MKLQHRQAAQHLLEQAAGGTVNIVDDPVQISAKGRKKLRTQPGLARASLGLARARAGKCPNCLERMQMDRKNVQCRSCGWHMEKWPQYLRAYLPNRE